MRKIITILSTGLILWWAGCEKPPTPEALFTRAEIKRDAMNIQGSIQDLSKLVRKFPEHELAAKSQFMIGFIYNNNLRDFNAAINAYRVVVSSYGETRFGQNAQFMIGYIYANELNDIEKARQEYELFLELYTDKADSGLVQSAKFELQNLGKDINEIPTQKSIAS